MAVLGLAMYLSYTWVSGMSRDLHSPPAAVQQAQIEERIRPIGQVRIAGMDTGADVDAEAAQADETVAAAAPGEAPVASELDGERVYRIACTACHGPGIAGAPRTGDANAWAARMDQGMDTLVRHAIEGYQGDAGFMPARGGHPNLTDEQVRAAVQYMVDQLGG